MAETKIRFNLQRMLDERGISQREFARMSGARLETVNKFAKGELKRIPVDFLDAACRELKCGISDLMDYPTRR